MKKFRVTVDGQTYEVEVEEVGGTAPSPSVVETEPEKVKKESVPVVEKTEEIKETGEGTPVTAPMPGTVLDIKVNVGDEVEEGDIIAVLEAMKMENEISATVSGKIRSIPVSKGANVDANDTIVIIG